MKMETPFTGKLAVLGVRGRSGHLLAVDGKWSLRDAAPVTHATEMGGLHYFPTAIGRIQRLRIDHPAGVMYAEGVGVEWLAQLLEAGTHALSMDMDNIVDLGKPGYVDAVQGRVAGALLVRADAFAWAGVRS